MKTTTAPSAQSLAAFAATKGHAAPKQIGTLTLYQAAELCDAVSNISVCCHHAFALAGLEMPERYFQRLEQLSGDRVTLAKALRILRRWKAWTWADDFPTAAHAEGFLHELPNL